MGTADASAECCYSLAEVAAGCSGFEADVAFRTAVVLSIGIHLTLL